MFHVEHAIEVSQTGAWSGCRLGANTKPRTVLMGHAHLRVRFYPTQGQWMCVVQRLGADGMPEGEDAVSAVGATKEAARDAAIASTTDQAVIEALRAH